MINGLTQERSLDVHTMKKHHPPQTENSHAIQGRQIIISSTRRSAEDLGTIYNTGEC